MTRRSRPSTLSLVALGAAAALAFSAGAGADSQRASVDRATYLATAEQGVGRITREWWNPDLRWYNTYRGDTGDRPLASAWDAFPLFEATAAVAIAHPTAANRAAVTEYALGAERYWNPDLKPLGGYEYYPDERGEQMWAFFDDTGWLGVAFFDAYRATRDKRFLRDAIRAFRFIDIAGWDADAGGGVWWDTGHQYKTAEPLAAAAVLGAEIYGETRIKWYLAETKKLIAWADAHAWNAERGLYARSDTSDTVMNYVEGMMIGAHVTLCRVTKTRSYCRRAEQLAEAAQVAFPTDYHWAPETDVIYLRWFLDLYKQDRDPRWYALVEEKAEQALANAADATGIFTKRWDGEFASRGRILTPAATVSLFAWIAGVAPPAR